jgi:hypothetical protein
MSSDFEIDIEILDAVDYSLLEGEDADGVLKRTLTSKGVIETEKPKQLPDDIKSWLEII